MKIRAKDSIMRIGIITIDQIITPIIVILLEETIILGMKKIILEMETKISRKNLKEIIFKTSKDLTEILLISSTKKATKGMYNNRKRRKK